MANIGDDFSKLCEVNPEVKTLSPATLRRAARPSKPCWRICRSDSKESPVGRSCMAICAGGLASTGAMTLTTTPRRKAPYATNAEGTTWIKGVP